jgi:hypothetical protein
MTLTRWTTEALGISANLQHLDDLTLTRFKPDPVTEDVEVDMPSGDTITKTVTVTPDLVDVKTPYDFELNYEYSRIHLLKDWCILVGLAFLFGAGTILTMKRKDVV